MFKKIKRLLSFIFFGRKNEGGIIISSLNVSEGFVSNDTEMPRRIPDDQLEMHLNHPDPLSELVIRSEIFNV